MTSAKPTPFDINACMPVGGCVTCSRECASAHRKTQKTGREGGLNQLNQVHSYARAGACDNCDNPNNPKCPRARERTSLNSFISIKSSPFVRASALHLIHKMAKNSVCDFLLNSSKLLLCQPIVR